MFSTGIPEHPIFRLNGLLATGPTTKTPSVMAGLDPAIHAYPHTVCRSRHVDTRVKPAHDELSVVAGSGAFIPITDIAAVVAD